LIYLLDRMPENERDQVLNGIKGVTETHMLGNYEIPYDNRNHYDWIEGILATLQAHLKG